MTGCWLLLGTCLAVNSAAFGHDVPAGLSKTDADLYQKLTDELAIETIRWQIATKRREIAILQEQAGAALKSAADSRLSAAQVAGRIELAARRYPDITINVAKVFQASDPTLYCNATYFVEWKCNRGDPFSLPPLPGDKCDFLVDKDICGAPAQTGQPMLFEVLYSCGTIQRDLRVPFGTKAYLTCR